MWFTSEYGIVGVCGEDGGCGGEDTSAAEAVVCGLDDDGVDAIDGDFFGWAGFDGAEGAERGGDAGEVFEIVQASVGVGGVEAACDGGVELGSKDIACVGGEP